MLGGEPFSTKVAYSTMYKVVDDPMLSMVWSLRYQQDFWVVAAQ